MKIIDTPNAPKPMSNYSQGIVVPSGNRHLHCAGQIGITLDGTIPDDPAAQHDQAWKNAMAILDAEGMDHRAVVMARVYITDPAHVPLYRETRDRFMQGHKPAATLLVVAGLADPRLVVEVELMASA